MELSNVALGELRSILEQDIGKDLTDQLSQAEIHNFGMLLLTIAANELKRCARMKEWAKSNEPP